MVRKKKAFTLIEVVIAMGIMAVAFLGLVAAYISGFDLAETAKNTTYALNAAQKKIEEIRDYNFFDISNDYDNTNFTIDGISAGNSNGLVEIDNTNPDLLVVTVAACWRQKGGRIIGGDAALNPLSTSPARLVTYIADR
ncbi:MAG: type II secretion system protein [Candidatus Omnitrophota bacterium]|nr:type II secretion system protein [Candidatus Omnitrophota bacterium]